MTLNIPLSIWRKMRAYVESNLPNEITGIGTVKVVDPDNLLVEEIFLPRQRTTPEHSEFLEGELNQIIDDLVEHSPSHSASALRFRWHSHAHGEVFWSEEDEDDIEAWDAPWLVSLVMNATDDCLVRFDHFDPLRLRSCPVKLHISDPIPSLVSNICWQEVCNKVVNHPHHNISQKRS